MPERKGRAGEVFCGRPASFIEKGRHEHRLVGRELVLPLHFKTHPRISSWLSWDANPGRWVSESVLFTTTLHCKRNDLNWFVSSIRKRKKKRT